MPRFFFETSIDDSEVGDEEGLDYPDLAAARRDAGRSLRPLVAEAMGRGGRSCAVTVRGESGTVVARFSASLAKEP